MTIDIIVIILSLILSAFFSGMEIAYVSSNKIHIEIEKKQGDLLSNLLTKITAKPSKFIATMLIGNNIALVIYGFYMGDILVDWFAAHLPSSNILINYLLNELSLLTQTVISTLVILVTAEFLPKVFFQIYANSLLKLFAVPVYIFYILFSLVSDFVIWISDVVLKTLFKTEGDEVQLAFSKVELGNYISEQMESVEAHDTIDSEIQIFQNALEFSEVKSREVMVPRTGEIFDTISVCFSKGLGAPVGSMLVGDDALMNKALRIRKMLGGGMRQIGMLAAAASYGLDAQFDRLKEDHQKAKDIQETLQELEAVSVVEPVETNIVIFKLNPQIPQELFLNKLKAHEVLVSDMGAGKLRMVTHLDYTDAMHAKLLEILRKP